MELFVSLSKYKEEPEQKVSSSHAKYTLPAQTNKPLEEKKKKSIKITFFIFFLPLILLSPPLPHPQIKTSEHINCRSFVLLMGPKSTGNNTYQAVYLRFSNLDILAEL